MSEKTMVKFYPGTGKPLVGKIDLLDENKNVLHTFQSRNEYKKARKLAKAHAKKVRKANG